MCTGSLTHCIEYIISGHILRVTLASVPAIVFVPQQGENPGVVNSDEGDLTVGPGIVDIIRDYYPPGPKMQEILDILNNEGTDYIRVEAFGLIGGTLAKIGGKVCLTLPPFTTQQCERAIAFDEEEIAELAKDNVDLVEGTPGIGGTSGRSHQDRENIFLADLIAIYFAHEVCHLKFPGQDPAGNPANNSQPENTGPFWSQSVNVCARELYNEAYGDDPLHYKLAQCAISDTSQYNSSCLQGVPLSVPPGLNTAVYDNKNNFDGLTGMLDVLPTIPPNPTIDRVTVLL